MIRTFGLRVLMLMSISFTVISCLDTPPSSQGTVIDSTLLEKAATFEDLSTFIEYVNASNLRSAIQDSQLYTLFAPTNRAFEQLPEGILDTLSTDQLTEILSYHLSDSAHYAEKFMEKSQLQSVQGDSLYFFYAYNTIFINDGTMVAGNYRTENGILHATDKVLFPDKYLTVDAILRKRPALNRFSTAIDSTSLKKTLKETATTGYTVFPPTNRALLSTRFPENADKLQNRLKHHIISKKITANDLKTIQSLQTLSGKQVFIDGNNGTIEINGKEFKLSTDISGKNGIVHVITTP